MNENFRFLQHISSIPKAADQLAQFEFEIIASPNVSDYFTVESASAPLVIARDGSGGEFSLVQMESDHVLVYVTSEGKAGVPAPDLKAFVALLLSVPNWRDLCHYSGGGQISEMKKAHAFLSAQNQDTQDERTKLGESLGIQLLKNPVEQLHRSLCHYDGRVRVVSKDVERARFHTLFNSFTIEDNPFYGR